MVGLIAYKDNKLKVDVEKITGMKNKVNDIIEELTNTKNDIIQAIEDLKKDWNTPAGKKFIQDSNTDWGEQVEQYIKTLEGIETLLSEAETEYQKIEEEATKINF